MIEILVKYIQDKGFEVDVLPGFLIIRKVVQDEICSMQWSIFPADLRPDLEEVLFYDASRLCEKIDRAIAERTFDEHANNL